MHHTSPMHHSPFKFEGAYNYADTCAFRLLISSIANTCNSYSDTSHSFSIDCFYDLSYCINGFITGFFMGEEILPIRLEGGGGMSYRNKDPWNKKIYI